MEADCRNTAAVTVKHMQRCEDVGSGWIFAVFHVPRREKSSRMLLLTPSTPAS